MEKSPSFFDMQWAQLESHDPEVAATFQKEAHRLQGGLELIASENVVSTAVLAAMASVFTNKYAEGYPGRRYYGGCQWVDEAEDIARERAKKLFGAEHANVQPHSGAQANQSVFMALLKPGDRFLGMSLAHGGHLTHGSPVNLSGQYYQAHGYGVDDQGLLDYDDVRRQAHLVQPKLIVAGGSAYPRLIDFAAFRSIADEVGALLMVDMAHIAGLVAAGAHPSPIPHAHVVTTTTHKTLRGPRGGLILCKGDFAKAVDKALFPGIQGGPLMHIIGAKAVAFGEAFRPSFKEYGNQVIANAKKLAHCLMELGHSLVSGGTDNHLMLVDLKKSPLSGQDAESLLAQAEITANKNAVPGDPRSPMVTSGVRLGTPAITTRGLKEDHMVLVAQAIDGALKGDPKSLEQARAIVAGLCQQFPLYQGVVAQKGYLAPQDIRG